MVSVYSVSNDLIADSTLAIISVAEMFEGATAKFKPFVNKDNVNSALLRSLEERLITHLVLST